MTDHEKAELYDHMLEVAKASGFDCLTAAIVAGSKYKACEGDIRWAINVLLETVAKRLEGWDTMDIWRSEAADTVRGFKHPTLVDEQDGNAT